MLLPQEFVNRMREMLGEEELAAFLSSYDRPMSRALRLNPLKMRENAYAAAEDVPGQQEMIPMELLSQEFPALAAFHLQPVPWAQPYGFYYGAQDQRGGNAASGLADSPLHPDDLRGLSMQEEAQVCSPTHPGDLLCSLTGNETASGQVNPAEIGAGEIRPGRSPLHEAGLYYIQEPSAMAAAALAQLAAQALLTGEDVADASHGELRKAPPDPAAAASGPQPGNTDSISGSKPRQSGSEPRRPASVSGSEPRRPASVFGSEPQRTAAVSDSEPRRLGQKVLDLCAAPGGKTTMLSSFLGGEGLLVANEIEPVRARILSQNVERMGIRNAIVTNESPEHLAGRFPAFFDQVVVDAPCSGEGMFRREEQAVTTWSLQKVASCARLQAQILDHAAVMVKSGGLLVYSTCTFAPEEDEGQVCRLLAAHPEFTPVDLPALLGEERMLEYGFEKGRAQWAGAAPAEAEKERSPRGIGTNRAVDSTGEMERNFPNPGGSGEYPAARADVPQNASSCAVRLWPHRLKGEGHFVAIFRREGEYVPDPVPQGCGFSSNRAAAAGKEGAGRGKIRTSKHDQAYRSMSERDMSDRDIQRRCNANRGMSSRMSGASVLRAEEWQAVRDCAADNLAVNVVKSCADKCGADFVRFGDEIYLAPYASQISMEGLKIVRAGLHLGTLKKGRFEPAHALAVALRPEEAARCVNLPADDPRAAAYLRGESIPCDPALKGWTLITFDGIAAGWGKASGGMLRNHYPKGLRRSH